MDQMISRSMFPLPQDGQTGWSADIQLLNIKTESQLILTLLSIANAFDQKQADLQILVAGRS